ncbi:hypothetical protein Tco_1124428 [Tanacetum coccineum]|uniref:Uncharacterized protein n=1 Tax=Tanacetum coccineum TaxID=301880 RepID=A0ABQ5J947_9ASTR
MCRSLDPSLVMVDPCDAGNSLVYWNSKIKATFAISFVEAMYRTMCNVCCETMLFLKVLSDLHLNVKLLVEMNYDNSCLHMDQEAQAKCSLCLGCSGQVTCKPLGDDLDSSVLLIGLGRCRCSSQVTYGSSRIGWFRPNVSTVHDVILGLTVRASSWPFEAQTCLCFVGPMVLGQLSSTVIFTTPIPRGGCFLKVSLCLNLWENMALQGHPHVVNYPNEAKSIKYENFMRDHVWAKPHSPCILGKKEKSDQPPDSVTTFYLEYALDCNIRKSTRSSVQAGGSGSAIASEELNTSSTSDVPLNVTPSITVYPISDDDDLEKVDVASRSKLNKKRKKTKAKKIFVDASVILQAWEIKMRKLGFLVLRVVGVVCWILPPRVNSVRAYLESIMLPAHTLKANEAEAARRHSEELTNLKGQIAKLEVKIRHVNDDLAMTAESDSQYYDWASFYKAEKEKLVETLPLQANHWLCSPKFSPTLYFLQRSVMSLGAHLLSVEIREEVPDVPESILKLDEGVAGRVSEEGAVLYTRLWSYLLELVASKDEDVNGLLAIRAPFDANVSSSSQMP